MKGLEYFDKAALSEFVFDKNRLLTSMEFENLVELRRLISIQLKISVEEIHKEQDEIIRLIKKEPEK